MVQILLNIIITFSCYLVIARSISLQYSTSSFFNLSHAITLTLSPYLTYFLFIEINMPLTFAILFSITGTMFVSILSERFIYRPLRNHQASSMIMMIASLGLYLILQNIISIIWGDEPKSFTIKEVAPGYRLFAAHITDIQILTIVICIILFIGCSIFFKYNKIGRNILAVSTNSELANILGINSNVMILYSFGVSAFLSSIAGILIALDSSMNPLMGFNWLLYGIVAMIIGGVNSNSGLIGGSLLLAVSQHLVAYYIGSQWMDAIAYIILILFLIWKPLGFSGKRLKKVEI